MQLAAYLRQLARSPKLHDFWDKLTMVVACMVAIFLTAWLTRQLSVGSPILLASMGASAVILFVMPSSPLAQPWPLLGGHLCSGLVGVWIAHGIHEPTGAAAAVVALSVLAMLSLRCLHPPGVATALIPVLNYPNGPSYDFLLMPLAVNVGVLLLLTLIINRLLLRRNYPSRINLPKDDDRHSASGTVLGFNQADITMAVRDSKQFIDVSAEELQEIFIRLQLQQLQKQFGNITCGDIMQRNVVTLEYASEVEAAWSMMHERQLKIVPVLDRCRRVIGIVTLYDFLKNLQLSPYADFQGKWLTFIKRTTATSTDKPEAIGHIMTRKVKTLPASAAFSELIPMLLNEGHRHVPIVDDEQRFVGLVSQSNLIRALSSKQTVMSDTGQA